MFFVVSKILKVFIYPLTWIIGLLMGASLVGGKRKRRWMRGVAIALIVIFSEKPLMEYARYEMTKGYQEQQLPKGQYAVAVIMGGFGRMNRENGQIEYVQDRGSRLWEGVRLYESGKVEKLLISGDATSGERKDGTSDAGLFLQYMDGIGIADSDIVIEPHARNTIENARYSIELLDSLGYTEKDCLVVTSATHMERAIACFASEGWSVAGYATNIYSKPHATWNQFIPSWKTLTDWHEVLNEWVGGKIYRAVGYGKKKGRKQ